MNDIDEIPDNAGGEGGGRVNVLKLKRSELAILRKYANRYPLVDAERQETVDIVMQTLRTAETPRNKIAAAQTVIALDRVNLEEIKVYLAAKKDASDELKPASSSSVNVNVTNNVVAGNSVQITDITSEEFKALPVGEQLRLTREAIQAMNE